MDVVSAAAVVVSIVELTLSIQEVVGRAIINKGETCVFCEGKIQLPGVIHDEDTGGRCGPGGRCLHESVKSNDKKFSRPWERTSQCEKAQLNAHDEQRSCGQNNMHLEADVRRYSVILRLRWVRLIGGMLLLYPVCMIIVSNYAKSRGLLPGWADLHMDVLRVGLSFSSNPSLTNREQSLPVPSGPRILSDPSPLVFLVASLIWTVLEWAHYQSKANDRYQMHILGSATVLGMFPVFATGASVLGTVVSTVPWAIHLALVGSDVLHSAVQR